MSRVSLLRVKHALFTRCIINVARILHVFIGYIFRLESSNSKLLFLPTDAVLTLCGCLPPSSGLFTNRRVSHLGSPQRRIMCRVHVGRQCIIGEDRDNWSDRDFYSLLHLTTANQSENGAKLTVATLGRQLPDVKPTTGPPPPYY